MQEALAKSLIDEAKGDKILENMLMKKAALGYKSFTDYLVENS